MNRLWFCETMITLLVIKGVLVLYLAVVQAQGILYLEAFA